ncbi:TonB-dependent receptor [Pseudoxanthomonas dokdonensis]|uniref:TonB-dependent receptor n=1 Tax=Pseudoxanthomonas dokdonensis TaxID=344882 RepID=UPI00070E906A|nr:TonB-dependent receptor [Pseudoxanthomonas dokdonensis]
MSNLAIVPGYSLAQETEPPAPARSTDVTELETVSVTGRRAADRLAIDDKRYADGQVDAIRADDVGKLPDQNVAESVRRLPGISTVNDQGEGRYLTVRGVSPDLLNVTLNGQTSPAPEPDGRQVKLDDIPSGLIGAVTVSKTLTPDMDANAIAGQVNIETLSAFDREGTFGTASAAYGYNDLSGEHPYEFDGSLGGRFGADDQFGAVVAINYSDRKLGTQNVQNTGDWIDVDGQIVPEGIDLRQYNTHRQRSGAVANFDWRPNEDTKAFLRFVYSKYQDSETRDRYGIEFDEDGITPADASSGTFTDGEAFRALRTREEDTSTFTTSAGAEFKFDESKLNFELTYSRANKRDPHRDEWGFVQGDVTGQYQLGSDSYTVTPDNDAVYDSSLYEPDFYEPESRHAVEDLYQARIDYMMPMAVGDGSDLQFGAKYLDRKKTNDGNGEAWEYAGGPLTLADVAGGNIGSIFHGRYPFGPTINGPAADDYFNNHPDEFEEDMDGTLSTSLAGDYRINEKIYAAYVMGRLRFGDFMVIPGVRMERTEGQYAANSFELGVSTLDQPFNSFGGRSYTDWFPGINVRYDVSENVVIRAAATRAIGRPNYESLAPFTEIEDAADDEPAVTQGNPNLKPLYSNNFDLATEFYVGNRGVVSAAVFYKQIDNPIYEVTLDGQDGNFGGLDLINAEVGSWTNAESATVKGLELNAQYELSFLPSPFDGFSVSGNVTFVDSEAEGLPSRDDKVPLLNQSDRVASAQISYEKYGLSARIGYTYRSAALNEASEDDPDADIYQDDYGQWDARVSYACTSNLTVFLEGSNLNDEAMRTYVGYRNRMGEKEIYGYTVRTGLQYKF